MIRLLIIGGLLALAGCTVYPVGYPYGYPAGAYGYGYPAAGYGYGYPAYGYARPYGYSYAPQSGRALQATDYNPASGSQTGGH